MRGGAMVDHVNRGKRARSVDHSGIAEEPADQRHDRAAAILRVTEYLLPSALSSDDDRVHVLVRLGQRPAAGAVATLFELGDGALGFRVMTMCFEPTRRLRQQPDQQRQQYKGQEPRADPQVSLPMVWDQPEGEQVNRSRDQCRDALRRQQYLV